MKSNRYNMVVPIPTSSGGTYWHKIGAAWSKDNGQISLVFNSLPIPNAEGKVQAFLFEATDEPAKPGRQAEKPAADRRWSKELDDEIPF